MLTPASIQFGAALVLWAVGKALPIRLGLPTSFVDAIAGGVLGNAAHDVFKTVLGRAQDQSPGADGLPNNDPIERASRDALRAAIRWLLQLKVQSQRRSMKEVWQDAGEYARNSTELSGFVVRALAEPTARTWYRALNEALESPEFSAWHAKLQLSQDDIEQALRADRCDLQDFLADKLLLFARKHVLRGEEPADFEALVRGMRSAAESNVSKSKRQPLRLGDAYILCLRENVNTRPEIFRRLLSDVTLSMHADLLDLRSRVTEALDQSVSDFAVLAESLHEQLASLVQSQGLSAEALSELVSGQLMVQEQLWLSGRELQEVRAQLRYLVPAQVNYDAILDQQPKDGCERVWFDRQLDDWLEQTSVGAAPPYLVLEAGPFFGKTWISASAYRRRRDTFQPVAYHCFRRSEGLTRADEAFRSLGEQLQPWAPGWKERTPQSLREFIALLRAIPPSPRGKVLVIIDGLDEAFGPLSESPGIKAGDFLPSPEIVAATQVAFFVTLRPDFLVSWRDNRRMYRRVQIPGRELLINDVRTALPRLAARLQANGHPVPPDNLLPHFALASEGLLGLACQFFLRAPPERWQGWLRNPSSLPQGPAEALLDHWQRVLAAAAQRNIPAAQVRQVYALLARAREPLSIDQIVGAIQLADDESLRPFRPALFDAKGMLASLETVLSLNVGAFREPTGEQPRRHGFIHAAFAELLLRRIDTWDSGDLPARDEIAFAGQLFAVASLRLWQEPGPLRSYVLQHGPTHLRDAGRADALLSLVRNDTFLDLAEQSDMHRPELAVLALRTAFDSLLIEQRRDRTPALLELGILHAMRREHMLDETPLQAMQLHGLGRCLRLLGEISDPEERLYRTLVVAYWLGREARMDEARQVIHNFETARWNDWSDDEDIVELLKRLAAFDAHEALNLALRVLFIDELVSLFVEDIPADLQRQRWRGVVDSIGQAYDHNEKMVKSVAVAFLERGEPI